MAFSDAQTQLGRVITHHVALLAAYVTGLTNAQSVRAAMNELDSDGQRVIADNYQAQRQQHAALFETSKRLSEPWLVAMAGYIGSQHASGNRITNPREFFKDLRAYFVANTLYVAGRAVTYGNNPADGATGLVRRNTVDRHGEKIESGRHNQTVRGIVRGTEVAGGTEGSWTVELYGAKRLTDDILIGGSGGRIIMPNTGPENQSAVLCDNPVLGGNASETDNADITNVDDWDIDTSTATVKVDTVRKWRGSTYGISVGGEGVDFEISQPMRLRGSAEAPIGIMVPVFMNGAGWAGDITIKWGNKTAAFDETDLSNGNWVQLFIPFDANQYPPNFDTADSKWGLLVEGDAGITTNEVVIGGFYPIYGRRLVANEGPWYFYWADETDPAVKASFAFSADSQTSAGPVQDFFARVWGEYLRTTASGTQWTL